ERDHAVEQAAAARAVVALAGQPGDAEPGQAGNQVGRELLPDPVVVDDRRDRLLHERADRHYPPQAVVVKQLLQRVEISIDIWLHARFLSPCPRSMRARPPITATGSSHGPFDPVVVGFEWSCYPGRVEPSTGR